MNFAGVIRKKKINYLKEKDNYVLVVFNIPKNSENIINVNLLKDIEKIIKVYEPY